jgi:hypothetical protein
MRGQVDRVGARPIVRVANERARRALVDQVSAAISFFTFGTPTPVIMS